MRHFFRSYWKTVLVLIVLAALAAITINTSSAQPDLPTRLRAHARAISSSQHTASYIASELAGQGYLVQRQRDTHGGQVVRYLEAVRSNLQPNQQPARIFIVGAICDGDAACGSDTAAVLELARLLRDLRPSAGTELKFVFLAGSPDPDHPGAASFIAFIGAPESAAQVRQTLSAFHAPASLPAQGLAAPAYVQGVTLLRPSPSGRLGNPALLLSNTAFQGYPYRRTADADEPDYENMARAVTGLANAIPSLVAAQEM